MKTPTVPDPLARRYDFSKDPLDYANEQRKLIKMYRERILDKFVKDGDSWAKARRGYELTLSLQNTCHEHDGKLDRWSIYQP